MYKKNTKKKFFYENKNYVWKKIIVRKNYVFSFILKNFQIFKFLNIKIYLKILFLIFFK